MNDKERLQQELKKQRELRKKISEKGKESFRSWIKDRLKEPCPNCGKKEYRLNRFTGWAECTTCNLSIKVQAAEKPKCGNLDGGKCLKAPKGMTPYCITLTGHGECPEGISPYDDPPKKVKK